MAVEVELVASVEFDVQVRQVLRGNRARAEIPEHQVVDACRFDVVTRDIMLSIVPSLGSRL